MSGNAATLKFLLLGVDQLSKPLRNAGTEAEKTGTRTHGMGKKVALGMGALAVGVGAFATSSINKFKDITMESRGLQRALGGSLTDASRWRFAAQQSGVDAGVFTKSLQQLDKKLVTAAGSQKTAAKMARTLGMSFRDAHGHVLPMTELLPKISDKFKAMPDGAGKTALAMKLFGKAGNAMLPFLGKGSAGMADLRKESDKFGTTINNKAIDAVTKAKVSQRQWSAAMDGLKIQLGAALLPLLTKFVDFIRQAIIPIIQKASAFIRTHQKDFQQLGAAVFKVFKAVFSGIVMPVLKALIPAMASLAKWVGQNTATLVPLLVVVAGIITAMKIWTAVQAALNIVMEANPIMLVVVAIAALAVGLIYAYNHSKTFRNIVQGVFRAVAAAGKIMWGILKVVFTALTFAFKAIFKGFQWAWDNIGRRYVDLVVLEFRIIRSVISTVVSAVSSALRAVFNGLRWAWQNIGHPVFGFIKSGIRGVLTVVRAVVKPISAAFKGIGTGLKWAWDHVIGPILNRILGAIQRVQDAYNTLHGNPNGVTSQGGTVGGGPTFQNAQGSGFFKGGLSRVNELGTEAFLPRGSSIRTHAETMSAARMSGGGSGARVVVVNVQGALSTKAEIAREVKKALELDLNGGGTLTARAGAIRTR